jgi:hypothetical protein
MRKRLKVTLAEGWVDETDSRDNGVLTYVCERSKTSGTLQMSLSIYEGGKGSPPSTEDLLEKAVYFVTLQDLGRLDECSSGSCAGGKFASVVFWSQRAPRSQTWFISNGWDLITVTHTCRAEPDRTEVLEAARIAETVEIVEG